MTIKSLGIADKVIFTVFGIIVLVSIYLMLVPVLNYNFPFTTDQGRDMIDIRRIVELKRPVLIGPTTSINGVYLGPFYYYFNLPPYVISQGDPAALTYWNIFWYAAASVLLFWFFYKKNRSLAFMSGALFAMTPGFFYSARYFWNANVMPCFTVFYLIVLFSFFKKSTRLNSVLVGIISGLAMQIEAAFGVIFFPFLLIFSIFKRPDLKHLGISVLAFCVTLLPQGLFELRNNFVMSKTFIKEVLGDSQILGEKLALNEVFNSHLTSYQNFTGEIFQLPWDLGAIIISVSAVYLTVRIIQKKLDPDFRLLFLLTGGFVVFSFIFYLVVYHHPLKGWYTLGLRVLYLFIIAIFFADLFGFKKFGLFIKTGIFALIALSFISTFIDQSRFVPKSMADRSGDKSNLRNEIEAIDWVYTKAQGHGFKAYNYIPSVYDFPYQYLYWWHGTNKYGYQPEVLTYKDGVPEYIKDNDLFYTKKRGAGDDPLVFLIYEKDENAERLAAWLGNFTQYCTLEKEAYPWETTVEMRKLCK